MIDPEIRRIVARRNFLKTTAGGLGMMALADLMNGATGDPVNPLAPRAPHFPGKAKSVIFLFMEGGPSQMDLFDPKPELQKWHGKPLPAEMTKDLKLAFIKPTAAVLASPRDFKKHGKSGMVFSDYLPYTAQCADDICMVRSMCTDAFNHHPGQLQLFTGSQVFGRPTMGAWTVYGLGSESKNLPGFAVLSAGVGTSGGASNFSSGFLPSMYQGTMLRGSGDPILYLSNPPGVSKETQRAGLDAMRDLNREHQLETGDEEIASRIASYELAYRMQMAGPELTDFSKESPATLEMYGLNKEETRQYGTNALLARRMVERGVRFVLLMHASWDQHTNLNKGLKRNCEATDQPVAALLKDLKQRGLLDGGDPQHLRPGERRPRPSSERLHDVGCGRRNEARRGGGIDRRPRLQHRRGSRAHPRPAGHDDALPGLRSREADLPLHGPRLPPHRHPRPSREEDARLT
jgi:hypothetical protein